MLSVEGFKHHLDNIEHQTNMFNVHKLAPFLKSAKDSKQVLLNNFIEQQKQIEQLKMDKEDMYQLACRGQFDKVDWDEIESIFIKQ